jgi:hypothetical protein
MARARYADDPERAHLDALTAFEAEPTSAYAHEDELYSPYRERAWGGGGGISAHCSRMEGDGPPSSPSTASLRR